MLPINDHDDDRRVCNKLLLDKNSVLLTSNLGPAVVAAVVSVTPPAARQSGITRKREFR